MFKGTIILKPINFTDTCLQCKYKSYNGTIAKFTITTESSALAIYIHQLNTPVSKR